MGQFELAAVRADLEGLCPAVIHHRVQLGPIQSCGPSAVGDLGQHQQPTLPTFRHVRGGSDRFGRHHHGIVRGFGRGLVRLRFDQPRTAHWLIHSPHRGSIRRAGPGETGHGVQDVRKIRIERRIEVQVLHGELGQPGAVGASTAGDDVRHRLVQRLVPLRFRARLRVAHPRSGRAQQRIGHTAVVGAAEHQRPNTLRLFGLGRDVRREDLRVPALQRVVGTVHNPPDGTDQRNRHGTGSGHRDQRLQPSEAAPGQPGPGAFTRHDRGHDQGTADHHRRIPGPSRDRCLQSGTGNRQPGHRDAGDQRRAGRGPGRTDHQPSLGTQQCGPTGQDEPGTQPDRRTARPARLLKQDRPRCQLVFGEAGTGHTGLGDQEHRIAEHVPAPRHQNHGHDRQDDRQANRRRPIPVNRRHSADADDEHQNPGERDERRHDREDQPGAPRRAERPRLAGTAERAVQRQHQQRSQDRSDHCADPAGRDGTGERREEPVRDGSPEPQPASRHQPAQQEVGGDPGEEDRAQQ